MTKTTNRVLPLLALLAGCALVASDDTAGVVAPSRASFTPVGGYLVHRCGSLDCHGAPGRNLRLYGKESQRLDPKAVPGDEPTSAAELDADYRSVCALEPEILAQVVADHGAEPERLTIVRKMRGTESHKGGALVTAGDAQDRCFSSWLAGKTDAGACTQALSVP